jgi:molybdenum cofactor biosynthesis enzyme MoaA
MGTSVTLNKEPFMSDATMNLTPVLYRTYLPEDCPFETVMIDVTHRCNMACRNCYLPNRTVPDLDAQWLSTIFSRLPRGTRVRLVGAEPTLREDLPQIISDVRRHGHHAIILTNGLKLADRSYMQELKRAGLQIVYLSMNGGFDDDLYFAVDAMRCAGQKAKAFDNLRAEHICTAIGTIVLRGVNEGAVAGVLEAARRSRNVRELHFRSVAPIGRHMRNRPYKLGELLEIFTAASGVPAADIDCRERTGSSYDFRFGRLRVQLTEWPDLSSMTRGRLTPDGRVAPFFEHVIDNEGGY